MTPLIILNRARWSRSISETPSVDSDEEGTPAPAAGSERRSARQPKPTARKPQPIIEEEEEEEIEESSEEDEEDEEDEGDDDSSSEEERVVEKEKTPVPALPKAKTGQIQAKQRKSKSTSPPVSEDSDTATDDTL